jgi:hypothetical protein
VGITIPSCLRTIALLTLQLEVFILLWNSQPLLLQIVLLPYSLSLTSVSHFSFAPYVSYTFGGGVMVLGKCSTTWTTSPTLLTLVIFQTGFCGFALANLDLDPPSYLSQVAKITGACHHIQFTGWDGVSLTFCPCWPQMTVFLICTSQVAGITCGSNCAQPCH